MRTFNIIGLIAFCWLNHLSAQEVSKKIVPYRTWVSLNSEPFKIKGFLYEIKDSSISVSNSLVKKDNTLVGLSVTNIHSTNIEVIKLRRKNNIGKGVLIGAITGFAVGGFLGLISGDDPPCSAGTWFCFRYTAREKALIAGIPLSIGGIAIGALIGSVKIRIPINGSSDQYYKNKSILRVYSIQD